MYRSVVPALGIVALFLSPTTHAAALGPGVPVKQVVAPPHVIPGVETVTVKDFSGFNGSNVAGLIGDSLQDAERDVSKGLGALGGDLLDAGTDLAADAAANAVGGGIQGKLVGGLTKMAGGMAKDALEVEPVVLDSGLTTTPWRVVSSGGDATITGSIDVDDRVESYTAKVAAKDSKGKILKDKDGKTIYKEVPCKRRTVSANINWALAAGGETKVEDSFTKKASDSKCDSQIKNLASKDALAAVALKNVGPGVANTVLPAWKQHRLPLKKDKMLVNELKLARQGEHQQAICGMRGLVTHDPNYTPGLMNYAALHEAMGWHDVAAEYYQKASALDSRLKPAVKGYTRAIERKAEIESMVDAYGIKYKIGEADYSTCAPIPEGQRMFVKKPTQLFEGADAANSLADLPKGMFVYVSDMGDGMYKVTTADGREGFVNGKFLK